MFQLCYQHNYHQDQESEGMEVISTKEEKLNEVEDKDKQEMLDKGDNYLLLVGDWKEAAWKEQNGHNSSRNGSNSKRLPRNTLHTMHKKFSTNLLQTLNWIIYLEGKKKTIYIYVLTRAWQVVANVNLLKIFNIF